MAKVIDYVDDGWTPPAMPPRAPVGSPKPSTNIVDPPNLPKDEDTEDDPRLDLPPKPKLTRLDVPRYDVPTFPDPGAAGGGYGPTDGVPFEDKVLTRRDQLTMLAQNNIRWPEEDDLGSMQPYVLDGGLRQSGHQVVRFSELNMTVPSRGRQDNAGFSYSESESSLQRHLVFEGELGVGVPPVFSMDVSLSDKSAKLTQEGKIVKIFQASQMLEKARVTFIRDLLSLEEWFIRQVNFAFMDSGGPERHATELLRVLHSYGQFVALDRVIGGRISLKTTSKAEYRMAFNAVEHELKAAAAGRFRVDGVKVDAKGAAGVGYATTAESGLKGLEVELKMEMVGGNASLASSEPGTLGTQWVNSVGPFINWRTIGFAPHTLMPILDLLDDDLKGAAIRVLRAHFLRNLVPNTEGEVAGHASGKHKFGRDISSVKRISKVEVNHEGNVDSIAVTYEVFTGDRNDVRTKEVTETYGTSRGSWGKTDSFTLAPDDDIVRIVADLEKKNDGQLKRVRFESLTQKALAVYHRL
jgi:hypothetical protein